MKPEIKVGQVRTVVHPAALEKVTIREQDERRPERFLVVKQSGRTMWLLAKTIATRWPVVLTDAPPEAKAEHQHDWRPAAGGGFECAGCPAFSVGAVSVSAAHSCNNCEGIDPAPCLFNPSHPQTQVSPSAPSPLEVVRGYLEDVKGFSAYAHDVRKAEECLRALATLEESIRRDQRAKDAALCRDEYEKRKKEGVYPLDMGGLALTCAERIQRRGMR